MSKLNTKQCSICGEWFPCTTEYFYRNKSNSIDGFYPYCKKCTKKKSAKWQKDNRDRHNESMRKFFQTEKGKALRKSDVPNVRKRLKEWQMQNPERLREYRIKRGQHKSHDITETEWENCKEYFNYSCAYCGISEEIAKEEQGHSLHKEHVDNNGSNDITNCVPSCRSCNSQKWEFEFDEWYNKDNPIYSEHRHNKIVRWLDSFAIKI